jgi:hypothetical protein
MRPSLRVRNAEAADSKLLATLASQVWLHTYATDGISADIADYVLSELTPEKFLAQLEQPASLLLVAERGPNMVGLLSLSLACSAQLLVIHQPNFERYMSKHRSSVRGSGSCCSWQRRPRRASVRRPRCGCLSMLKTREL